MGSVVLRGILSTSTFIRSIASSDFPFSGFAVAFVLVVIALVLGYALIIQVVVIAVMSMAAILAQKFKYLANMNRPAYKKDGIKEEYKNENSSACADTSGKVKIGSMYWKI